MTPEQEAPTAAEPTPETTPPAPAAETAPPAPETAPPASETAPEPATEPPPGAEERSMPAVTLDVDQHVATSYVDLLVDDRQQYRHMLSAVRPLVDQLVVLGEYIAGIDSFNKIHTQP